MITGHWFSLSYSSISCFTFSGLFQTVIVSFSGLFQTTIVKFSGCIMFYFHWLYHVLFSLVFSRQPLLASLAVQNFATLISETMYVVSPSCVHNLFAHTSISTATQQNQFDITFQYFLSGIQWKWQTTYDIFHLQKC